MCAKCSSRAISSSVTFTMPRSFLNSAGTCLLVFGSSIDSVRYVTTMRFCSRVMPRSGAAYGAIGVSLILCTNVVIILTCLISRCKNSANRVKYKINIYFYLLYLASRTATVGSEMQPIFERATLKVTKNPHSIGIMPRKIYFCAYKAHFRSGYATASRHYLHQQRCKSCQRQYRHRLRRRWQRPSPRPPA